MLGRFHAFDGPPLFALRNNKRSPRLYFARRRFAFFLEGVFSRFFSSSVILFMIDRRWSPHMPQHLSNILGDVAWAGGCMFAERIFPTDLAG